MAAKNDEWSRSSKFILIYTSYMDNFGEISFSIDLRTSNRSEATQRASWFLDGYIRERGGSPISAFIIEANHCKVMDVEVGE